MPTQACKATCVIAEQKSPNSGCKGEQKDIALGRRSRCRALDELLSCCIPRTSTFLAPGTGDLHWGFFHPSRHPTLSPHCENSLLVNCGDCGLVPVASHLADTHHAHVVVARAKYERVGYSKLPYAVTFRLTASK